MGRRPRLSRNEAVYLLGTGATVLPPESRVGARRAPRATRTATGTAPAPDAAPTRVLGLDLAMGCTGWCLLVGGRPTAHGSFTLPDRRRNEPLAVWLMRRAAELFRAVGLLLSTYRPEIVGYEYPDEPRPSWSGGSKGREFSAVQGLSRAEGFLIALWPALAPAIPLVAVPVTRVKVCATGRVGATKDQVRFHLMYDRGWDLARWGADEVDAAAVALAAREAI